MCQNASDVIVRIISTYVENTVFYDLILKNIKDHLHIRGEYLRPPSVNGSELGSSPHTWRILKRSRSQLMKFRIISTYVENTYLCDRRHKAYQDHLHIQYSPRMWR